MSAAMLACATASAAQDVPPATAPAPAPGFVRQAVPARAPVPPRASLRAISLTLVAADMQSETISDDVPPAARKALEELRAFLPFKGYRLWDAGVIGAPSETNAATLRLRGQETQLFEITLARPKWAPSGALDVTMRDVTIEAITTRPGAGPPGESLMSANVRLASGETVIVGTSRIRGDRALVLLITGLPSSPGASPAAVPPASAPAPATPAPPAPAPAVPAPRRF